MGSPFQRCIDALERGAADCSKALGPLDVVCKVTELVQPICFNLKILDLMCGLVDFASDSIIDVVIKDLEEFIDRIHKMFYVSVTFTKHSFNFKTNSSKSLATIKDEIIADIKKQASLIYVFSYWMDIISCLMFLWTISKVVRYKRKFLSKNRYDNKYLSKQLRAFDAKRKDLQLETALPLRRKEKRKYIELTSLQLLRKERFRIARQGFFLFTSTTYMLSIILTDYSLFWLLSIIRYAARADDDIELPPFMSVTVGGNGIFVEIVRGIVDAMTPATSSYKIDVTPCLPSPSVPNTDRYVQIVFLIAMSWILLVFEPYALRLRQIIMNRMYPEKANERAAWLCNQIIRKRISFAKFARRKARQGFRNDSGAKNLSILNFLRVKLNRFWIVRKILGEDMTCTLCAISSKKLKKCESPNCTVKYCEECISLLKGTCPICMNPVEYGDLSDISEELDSSIEGGSQK
ncbi:hypothetical protein HA402_014952 [Bradysia odoriphaga]|nr:hypothetical protein HA402_014952 [Bradysia odoriphaga]